MSEVRDGQCGLCVHFGEHHPLHTGPLLEIRKRHQADDDLIEPCGLPKHRSLHLMVTPHSGCDGFEAAEEKLQDLDR